MTFESAFSSFSDRELFEELHNIMGGMSGAIINGTAPDHQVREYRTLSALADAFDAYRPYSQVVRETICRRLDWYCS